MSRFEMELHGVCGEFWQREAMKELDRIKKEVASGEISIDENGVARNCIGRALMSDMIEKVVMVTDKINVEATLAARDEEVTAATNAYKEAMKDHIYSAEEMFEMRAAFGEGTTVVDAITGRKIQL